MPYRDATTEEKDKSAAAIARAMDPGWSVGTLYEPASGNTPEYGRTLRHVDGYGVFLVWEIAWEHKPMRLKISGVWPRSTTIDGRTEIHSPYEGGPSITVDATKDPKRIAGDIQRRLLPEYLPVYRKQYDKAQAAEAEARATERTITALVAFTGGHQGAHTKTAIYLGNSEAYNVTAQGDTVRFEHFNCPLPTAIVLLALLDKEHGPARVAELLWSMEDLPDAVKPIAFEAHRAADPHCTCNDCQSTGEWSGHPDPSDPDNYWIHDKTGARIKADDGPQDTRPCGDCGAVWPEPHEETCANFTEPIADPREPAEPRCTECGCDLHGGICPENPAHVQAE